MQEYAISPNFHRNPGAAESAILAVQAKLGLALPTDYLEAIRTFNGGEGRIGKNYLIIWRISDILSNNLACRFPEYIPGFVAFGTDGGGEAYGFDTRTPDYSVVKIPFVVSGWEDAIKICDNFYQFIASLEQ